ncbi:Ferric iron ABC transporter, ATP-binding protein [hydrothermal vent metagenome]|uniref:Ferric iron ABC transporter, ATP-binding protein n=1 Tax=hydrothermal vent metagenome TaxID=652676 RepID=A0A3B1BJV4_9ZZZZ
MTPQLQLHHISIQIDAQTIIHDISLQLSTGEIGCLLGPSGCGKTTLLRAIAGFEQPAAGEIYLGGKLVASTQIMLPTEQRKVGMVFQDLALFPHLTVAENIAFGMRGASKQAINRRIDELLELIELPSQRNKYPHQLSGGQQQRIALVRAMAPRPDLLLLDEPFSSQDTERREQLAREVRHILQQDNITAMLVTHDQHEAFAMADHIGVMGNGRLLQWDTPYNLYHCPISHEVAGFIGQGVLVHGTVLDERTLQTELGVVSGEFSQPMPAGTKVELLVRPDDIIHDDNSTSVGTVAEKTFRGAEYLYTINLQRNTHVLCLAPSHHDHQIGEKIGVRLELDHLVIFTDPKIAG